MAQGIPTKATLILLEEGITVSRIARELGVTKQAVSAHLTGHTKELNRDLAAWLEANLDADTGTEVLKAIWRSRAALEEAKP